MSLFRRVQKLHHLSSSLLTTTAKASAVAPESTFQQRGFTLSATKSTIGIVARGTRGVRHRGLKTSATLAQVLDEDGRHSNPRQDNQTRDAQQNHVMETFQQAICPDSPLVIDTRKLVR